MANDDDNVTSTRILQVMAELHVLTRLPRTGWIMAGVRDPESISDHCFEAALFAVLINATTATNVDIGRVVQMLLFHELSESRLTDLPRRSAPYVKQMKHQAEEEIAKDLLGTAAPGILQLLEEFHAKETPEARLAEAAEELQIVFASLMYAKDGNGDMSEYPKDVSKYDGLGSDLAESIAALIGNRLGEYLNSKPHWSIGYDRPIS